MNPSCHRRPAPARSHGRLVAAAIAPAALRAPRRHAADRASDARVARARRLPPAAPPHVQPPADGRAAVALPVPRARCCSSSTPRATAGTRQQYEGLEALYRKYRDRGLVVVGFPVQRLRRQEPGTNKEIAEFCRTTYGIEFPMFEKTDRRRLDAQPVLRDADRRRPGQRAAVELPQVRRRPQRPGDRRASAATVGAAGQRELVGARSSACSRERTLGGHDTALHSTGPGAIVRPGGRAPALRRRAPRHPHHPRDKDRSMRIAIVGSRHRRPGQRLAAAPAGPRRHAVRGRGPTLGGHTATVDVTLDGVTAPVDTGFLVFNDRTYPQLIALFDELGVASVASEMSFSVRVDERRLEWAGTDLASLFAQPRNALRPAFWRMLADIVRFNRATTAMLATAAVPGRSRSASTSTASGYGAPFRDWYLLPMAAAIWSSPEAGHPRLPAADVRRASATTTACCRSPTGRSGAPCVGGARDLRRADRRRAARRARRHAGRARAPRRATASRSTPAAAASASTRSCSPATATRRSRLLADPSPPRSAAAVRRSATSPTASCCTPTPRCCRARAARGRRGITSPRADADGARPVAVSATSSTSCSRCRSARRWW